MASHHILKKAQVFSWSTNSPSLILYNLFSLLEVTLTHSTVYTGLILAIPLIDHIPTSETLYLLFQLPGSLFPQTSTWLTPLHLTLLKRQQGSFDLTLDHIFVSIFHFYALVLHIHTLASWWPEYRSLPLDFRFDHVICLGHWKVRRHGSSRLKMACTARPGLLSSCLLPCNKKWFGIPLVPESWEMHGTYL